MTTLYKLTDKDGYTRRGEYNQCLWGPNVSHSGTGRGDLCSEGYIHAYTSPFLAILLNPLHANFKESEMRLWKAEGNIVKSDKGLKVGCITLTTIEEISKPNISATQKTIFAILCAKAVCKNTKWNIWANEYLSGKDRSKNAAYAAANAAANAVAYVVANAAAYAAANATAYVVANAAYYATANAAAYAATNATAYTNAAYYAAAYANAVVETNLDLVAIAEKAMEYK